MYLNLEELNLVDNLSIIFAHRKKNKKKETLEEHLNLTKEYLEFLISTKKLNKIIDGLLFSVSRPHHNLLKKMFYNAVYLHDLGKINPSFQKNKMDNEHFDITTESSQHSLLSAKKYINIFMKEIEKIKEDRDYYCLLYILYSFAYQISKHHGRLSSFKDFNFKNDIKFQNLLKRDLNIPNFEFYILNKLLFSLLVSSDYYATAEYMTDLKTDDFGVLSETQKKLLLTKFESNKVIQSIREFQNGDLKFRDNDINKLRCEMFLEAEKRIQNNIDKNIFYLEAPTGSGKTLTSINLGLKLLEKDNNLNKLFYIFPFNTLVEQTKNTFDEIFSNTVNIEVINSITPIKVDKKYKNQEDEESEYDKSYMNRLFFHNPIILTTHVSLFNILFGTSKEDNYPLWQLANSVVIIDEIQSYNNNLWWYIIEFFQKYAKLLNIKIIIMSATLPKLDLLLKDDKKDIFFSLIKDRNYYFKNSLFKERVKLNFSLLENENFNKNDELREKRLKNLLTIFSKELNSNKKILFEFIKKDTAREVFDILKQKIDKNFEKYELTGDDNKAYRDFVISRTKIDNIKIIIVATQVIEAGIDIDMDIGFKDISTLDSEEQFMGRVNRSCKKSNSVVYFFYLDDETGIYKGDNRLEFNLRKTENQIILKDKNYPDFYKKVLSQISKNGLKFENGISTNIDTFNTHISKLNYSEISKTMTLINSQNYTLYFPFKIDINQYDIKEFKNIDNNLLTNNFLDGKKVWNKFKGLREIESFTEMKIEKSRINSLMQFFTFNIIKYGENNKPCGWIEEVGGIYYIEDYEDFITEDLKFNRKGYQERCKSNFW